MGFANITFFPTKGMEQPAQYQHATAAFGHCYAQTIPGKERLWDDGSIDWGMVDIDYPWPFAKYTAYDFLNRWCIFLVYLGESWKDFEILMIHCKLKVDFDHQPHIAIARIHGDSTLVSVETDVSGHKTVTGNAKKLKESAHYPVQFGLEISKMIQPYGYPSPNPDRVFKVS